MASIVSAAAVVGGAWKFWTFGLPLQKAQITKEQVDAIVQDQIAPVKIRSASVELELKRVSAERERFALERERLQGLKDSSPQLVVKRKVFEQQTVEGTREIRIELLLQNEGLKETGVSSISLQVYRGSASEQLESLLVHARALHHHERILDHEFQFRTNPPVLNDLGPDQLERYKSAWAGYQGRGESIHDSRMIRVDDSSGEIEWELLPDVSKRSDAHFKLFPSQAAVEPFHFLITSPSTKKLSWYRFEVSVVHSGGIRKQFDFIIPAHCRYIDFESTIVQEMRSRSDGTYTEQETVRRALPEPPKTYGSVPQEDAFLIPKPAFD